MCPRNVAKSPINLGKTIAIVEATIAAQTVILLSQAPGLTLVLPIQFCGGVPDVTVPVLRRYRRRRPLTNFVRSVY